MTQISLHFAIGAGSVDYAAYLKGKEDGQKEPKKIESKCCGEKAKGHIIYTCIMKRYGLHLLVCLVRFANPDNSSIKNPTLILNDHCIVWPSSKIREKLKYEKRHDVPFTISYIKFTHKEKCYNYVSPFSCIENEDIMIVASDSGSLISAIDFDLRRFGAVVLALPILCCRFVANSVWRKLIFLYI
ncbi:hypothetical protein AGLY_002734 [Aphis glycines]|uniref:Uncharacterized protein n=1 Tax=Aphis glycines TaxID=307491 RepID=A0A6G0U1K8_APHGL|nr:hypothetical protein AGLY_002734 [Aphis glycines]